jgi:hypothetical protein
MSGSFRASFQSSNGCFLSADQGQNGLLTARAREQKAWEIFSVEQLPDGKYSIRSTTGGQKYLGAEGGGGNLSTW